MNVLRAESALDERAACEADAKPAQVCSCGKQAKDNSAKSKSSGNPSKGKQNRGKGRYKAKQKKEEGKQNGKKKETRTCHECGEVGHLRANCPDRKSDESDRPAISEFKRWENKSGGNNGKCTDKNSSGLCCRVRGTSVAAAMSVKTPAGTEMEWVLDSASDVNVCNNRSILHNVRKDQVHFFLGYDGNTREDEEVSDVTLRVTSNKSPHAELKLPFTSLLLSPQAPDNLLSQDMLENDGWTVKYGFIKSQRVCWLRKEHVELLLPKTNRRYRLQAMAAAVYSVQSEVQQQTSDSRVLVERKKDGAASLERWHLRLGHLNPLALQRMVRDEVASGMEAELCEDMDLPCWSCRAAKMIRMSYKKTVTRRATRPFQKLMSDMCYVEEVTCDGYEHFQSVQDEASRYRWGFMLYWKENASEVVLEHLGWIIAQGHKMEVFNSDQGKVLFNNKLKLFLRGNGTEYSTTNSYSPEENGLVERMNGVVLSCVRCLLTAANMPWLLWGEAFGFAIEVMNISGSNALGGETPYFRRFGERPDMTSLRTWGCIAFIFTPEVLRKRKC